MTGGGILQQGETGLSVSSRFYGKINKFGRGFDTVGYRNYVIAELQEESECEGFFFINLIASVYFRVT